MDKADYILYGIIVIICLLIININISITNSSISNFSNVSNFDSGNANTFDTYTSDQIVQNWNATGCTIPLNDNIVTSLTSIPKDTADGIIHYYKQSNYTCGNTLSTTSSSNSSVSGSYTPDQITELQAIWKSSNCPAPYPVNYVNSLQKYNYQIGKKKFTQYVHDIVKNNKYNNVYNLTLDQTFTDCYGSNWKNDSTLMDNYNNANLSDN